MTLPTEALFSKISDFWKLLPAEDRAAIAGFWQGLKDRATDLDLAARSVDRAKSILTAPVTVRSLNVLFKFDDTTKLSESRPGFPIGHTTQAGIVNIPTLITDFTDEATTLTAGVDYLGEEGKIFFVVDPPAELIAPTVSRNLELVWKNFGFLIDFFRQNSANYRKRVQGIWFALMGGPQIERLRLGMSALLDVPFTAGGLVKGIRVQPDGSANVEIGDEVVIVPDFLVPKINVKVGDVIDGFRAITDAVAVTDFKMDPEFAERHGIPEILKFFTFAVTVESGVVVDLIGPLGSLEDLFSGSIDFIERAKPSYTDFVMDILLSFEDGQEQLALVTVSEPRIIELDLPSSVDSNPVNIHYGIDGLDEDLGSQTEEIYALQGDDRLDLDSDALYLDESVEIIDIP